MRLAEVNAQVEARTVKQLTDAVYPILIPVEEQCMRVQAENRDEIEKLARAMWRSFSSDRIQPTVTRFEVIDENGRVYVRDLRDRPAGALDVELSYQDEGRTLKVILRVKP